MTHRTFKMEDLANNKPPVGKTPQPLAAEVLRLQDDVRNRDRTIDDLQSLLKQAEARNKVATMTGWKVGLVQILDGLRDDHDTLVSQLNNALNTINSKVSAIDKKVDDSQRADELEIEVSSLHKLNGDLANSAKEATVIIESLKGEIKEYKLLYTEIKNAKMLVGLREAWIAATTGNNKEAIEKLDSAITDLEKIL